MFIRDHEKCEAFLLLMTAFYGKFFILTKQI